MLTKITDKFYIDFEIILYIDKQEKNYRIYTKMDDFMVTPVEVSSQSKEGKEFIRKLNHYLGET